MRKELKRGVSVCERLFWSLKKRIKQQVILETKEVKVAVNFVYLKILAAVIIV